MKGPSTMNNDSDRYTSSDGLLSSSDPTAVALWESIGERMEHDERTWTQRLRKAGIKLAHPDDGWVNREGNTFTPSYPRFNDGPQVGDLIAFGTPPDGEHYLPRRDHGEWVKGKYRPGPISQPESAHCGYRICRVTEVDDRTGILGRRVTYSYEDTGMRVPPRAPAGLLARAKAALKRREAGR